MTLPPAAHALLAATDAALAERGWLAGSLDPSRRSARPLVEVWAAVLRPEDDEATATALARGLAAIVTEQADSFPDNVFADCDYLAANLIRRARIFDDAPGYLEQTCAQVARLQRLFGTHTRICFRYTHDFTYGYDWAKWVARGPEARAGVLPFDREFLSHMEDRAHELLALIDDDDAEYPSLPSGQARNPFPFSREPAAEAALLQALADRGELPLAAWDADAAPLWDRPYAALRVEQAARMGLTTD
jgi:hypothetical protein